MKKNILLLITILVSVYSYGQGEIDAHRFSTNELTGTARGQAMGGAFGALGGDITGVAINPAGIGVYRSSEVVANMAFSSNQAKIDWDGTSESKSKTKFNFSNLSYIGYYPLGKDKAQSLNFGFNYNRLKNFDRDYRASGYNMVSSLTDYIASISNRANNGEGIDYRLMDTNNNDPYRNSSVPWLSTLGWNGYLINRAIGFNEKAGQHYEDTHYYEGIFPANTVDPQLNVQERGSVESYDFTVGTNFSDKFFVGATIAITDLYYSLFSTYDEDAYNGNDHLGGFTLGNSLETEGSGCQLKIGAIFKPIDALRIGVSYHSPTWYSMTDYYSATVDSKYDYYDQITNNGITTEYHRIADEFVSAPNENEEGHTDYRFQTPYLWTFSLAGVIGTKAVVSLDYEIKDYTSMNLKDRNGNNYETDNRFIDEDFRAASTLRAGLEYRITPQFSGRIGYAWMQNPYQTKFKNGEVGEVMTVGTVPHYIVEGDASYLTAGIGYRFTPKFYIDLAFVQRSQTDDLYFYSPVNNTEFDNVASFPASYKNKTYKGLLTLGYKF
jgi:long-subunit fatty acid transport protein